MLCAEIFAAIEPQDAKGELRAASGSTALPCRMRGSLITYQPHSIGGPAGSSDPSIKGMRFLGRHSELHAYLVDCFDCLVLECASQDLKIPKLSASLECDQNWVLWRSFDVNFMAIQPMIGALGACERRSLGTVVDHLLAEMEIGWLPLVVSVGP